MRYARVPQGTSTCGYCYMLASNGWYYKSEQAAAAGCHEGCDCQIIAAGNGIELPYDTEWMRSCWADCIATVDNASLEARSRAKWDGLSDEERAKFYVRFDRKTEAFLETLPERRRAELGLSSANRDEYAFRRFYASELRKESWREVERRDAGWLYNPNDLKVEQFEPDFSMLSGKQRKRLKKDHPEEEDTYKFMAQHGYRIVALPEDRGASANIDALIHIGEKIEYWEIKGPKLGRDALRKLIGEGVSKWDRTRLGRPQAALNMEELGHPRIIVDNRSSTAMDDKEAIAEIMECMRYYAEKGYSQTMFIGKDQILRSFKNSAQPRSQ